MRIHRVTQAMPSVVLFLGPLRGHLEHWIGKTTVPCYPSGACTGKTHALPVVYYAYAPVMVCDPNANVWRPFVLQATSSLQMQLAKRNLRGEEWTLLRAPHKKKRGEVQGIFGAKWDVKTIPPAFDIEKPLCRMLGVLRVELDQPNPNPEKLAVDVMVGPRPHVVELLPEVEEEPPATPDQLNRLAEALKGMASMPPEPGRNGR